MKIYVKVQWCPGRSVQMRPTDQCPAVVTERILKNKLGNLHVVLKTIHIFENI